MDKVKAVELILMRAAVHYPNEIMPPEWARNMPVDQLDEIIANYAPYYLTEEERS